MSSNLNRRFAQAMNNLERDNPRDYEAIKLKFGTLKTEAGTWRRQAQAQTPSVETPKKPLTDTHGEQSQRSLTTPSGREGGTKLQPGQDDPEVVNQHLREMEGNLHYTDLNSQMTNEDSAPIPGMHHP